MLMLGCDSLREVIAFPKNKEAVCVMTGAPDYVDREQLEALKLGTACGDRDAERKRPE